jgi:hypothetical protein
MPSLPTKLTVHAGPHARAHTLCQVALPPECPKTGALELVSGSERIATQVVETVGGPALAFLLPKLPKGRSKVYTLKPATGRVAEGVRLKKAGGRIGIEVLGEPFTSYHYEKCPARPYLAPLLGPKGIELTRAVEDKARPGYDHVHHRSVWIAHGLVNGTDNWSEDRGHGRSVHVEFDETSGGPVMGTIRERLTWVTASDAKVLGEERIIRVCAQPVEGRAIDFEYTLSTGEDAVLFGDTKEGGMLSVRVNPAINAPKGTIENAAGGVNEDETWGKRAHWCDYSGVIDGVHAGMTGFDHPQNYGFPVYWHVRNYGLMTANPFGVSYFEEGSGKRGDWVLGAHSSVTFRYRLYLHEGDVRKGRVSDAYHDYIHPPKVVWG